MKLFNLHIMTTKQLNKAKADVRAATNKQVSAQCSRIFVLEKTLKMIIDKAKQKGFKI